LRRTPPVTPNPSSQMCNSPWETLNGKRRPALRMPRPPAPRPAAVVIQFEVRHAGVTFTGGTSTTGNW
ncbi:MAG: hypothetical protein OXH68_15380, partial [Gammaproteobacteria bacterium]|nr:hypothetical protein [Gammaproteobacteria bacterium]